VREAFGALLGALLPEPERSAVYRRLGGDAAFVSLLLGIGEFVGGVAWVYESAMGVLRPLADRVASAFLAEAERRSLGPDDTIGFTLGGAVLWLAWLLRPTSWFILSVPLVGLLRVVAFLTTRQAIAEPTVWAAARLAAFARRRAAAARELASYGAAAEPDEVEADGATDLLVFAARQKPDWTSLATIEVAGRYYRVAALDSVDEAGRRRYRYRLREAPEHEVIRKYVAYEVPKSGVRWDVGPPSAPRTGEPS
jgi:hypothetical protein